MENIYHFIYFYYSCNKYCIEIIINVNTKITIYPPLGRLKYDDAIHDDNKETQHQNDEW